MPFTWKFDKIKDSYLLLKDFVFNTLDEVRLPGVRRSPGTRDLGERNDRIQEVLNISEKYKVRMIFSF